MQRYEIESPMNAKGPAELEGTAIVLPQIEPTKNSKKLSSALIADHGAASRSILRRLLRDRGFDVIEAIDGFEAIQALGIGRDIGEDFDLVFIDDSLPIYMDGPDCSKQFRKQGFKNLIVGTVMSTILQLHLFFGPAAPI